MSGFGAEEEGICLMGDKRIDESKARKWSGSEISHISAVYSLMQAG